MNQLLRRYQSFPFYILLLPLYFVFHGFVVNHPIIPVGVSLVLLMEYLGYSVLLSLFFFLLIRSWRPAFLLAFMVLAFHIFFGPLHDFLKSFADQTFLVKYLFLLPLALLVFLFLLVRFRKKKFAFKTLTLYLNLLLLVFILIDVVTLSFSTGREDKAHHKIKLVACERCDQPDIFLIIADGYSGKIPLQEHFRFDNSFFENQMRQRGFHVVDSTISNYNYTPFTMASIFSMDYLQGLEKSNRSLSDRSICFKLINDNPVVDFFKQQGYHTLNFGIFRFADDLPYRSTSFYKSGTDLIREQTLFTRMTRDIRFNLVTKLKIRSEIERMAYYNLEITQDLYNRTWNEIAKPSVTAPRFVYTHLEMPHYPYYFDSKGKPNALEDLEESRQVDERLYIEFLQYTNQKILKLTDHIMKHAQTPPLIMLMSDHAFREYANDSVDHKYHFMNLNMVKLPNKNYEGFYAGMSTVNQFRVVLNTQFRQQLPLLKDSTIYLNR